MVQKILRRPEVEKATGLTRSSIYAAMAEGRFPKPIKLGNKAVGWFEEEIGAWQDARKARRDIDANAEAACKPALRAKNAL